MDDVAMKSMEKRKRNCLSEVDLDRFHLKEMSMRERIRVKKHLVKCNFCGMRLSQMESGLDGIPGLNAERMIENIHRALSDSSRPACVGGAEDIKIKEYGPQPLEDTRRSEGGGYWVTLHRKVALVAVSVVGVAILLGLMGLHNRAPWEDRSGEEIYRLKGGLDLQILRLQSDRMVLTALGDRFYKNDRLGFVVDLVSDGHIMIVGVEENGRMYVGYPMDGSAKSLGMQRGRNILLPGTLLLNGSVGREWMVLMHCPKAFTLSQLKYDQENHLLHGPEGCVQKQVGMLKE